ncbi:uncharacterized protein LOC131682115 [Topomyia yanbarensis]|uniref:uncharacterized protein LOC131682115 n=1 Tax=Topomyia yanbarensis TaxID=2498891 RepID=UPI00273CA551|nr:uncharacterized protein LOC131682115 [Topomyia yanbarensis]XP_058819325.1 uncharacterized protein LOC131682115 [Topomyia yanbarensis]XP_058819326.1 uncharacterized protein LOC131682115 [Topomyia yanbarensis]
MMVADFVTRQQNGSPINGEIPGQNHNNSNMPAHSALLMSSESTGRGSPVSPDTDYNGNGYDLSSHLQRKELFSQRKQREFIPDNKKDDSYWDRRRRNNEAAKRSREKRRFNDMVLEQRVVELTKENHVLKAQLDAIKNKYNICGENLVSVDQIMATLPTNEQVLSSTKRVKINSTPPLVFPLSRTPVPQPSLTPQPMQQVPQHLHQPHTPQQAIQQQHSIHQPPQQQSQQAAVIHPNPNIESPPPPQSIASQLQQITIQHTNSHYSHHSPAAMYREYEPMTNGSSRCDSNKRESTIRSPLARVDLLERDEHRNESLVDQRDRDRERDRDRIDVPSLPVPTFGSANSHISGPHISHHPYVGPYSIPNYPVSYNGNLYSSPPREINALLTANVLNLSRRAPSPYETSNGTGSNSSHSSSGDDEHDREQIHDHNNSLPVKLRHKSHLGDKDAASALLALQNIKQEPQLRSSSPWDDGDGSSDERDSGISTEWPTKAEQKMMVPLPCSPPSTSVSPMAMASTGSATNIVGGKVTSIPASVVISKKAEENIHLQSKLARLESEVATIKNMMISNTTGSGFGVTAAAQ